jgi:hypothetical protein
VPGTNLIFPSPASNQINKIKIGAWHQFNLSDRIPRIFPHPRTPAPRAPSSHATGVDTATTRCAEATFPFTTTLLSIVTTPAA